MILDIFRMKSAKEVNYIAMQFINTSNKSMGFSRFAKIAYQKFGLNLRMRICWLQLNHRGTK